MYNTVQKHDVWNNFLLHKKKVFRKTQELVHHPASNIGKILPIITTVGHLVYVQNHCYCMQISRYHINTLLSMQFPHLHGQTGVSNIQSNIFSKRKLGSHTCLNLWPSLETYFFLFIASAFVHFILTAHYLYPFSRCLFLVFNFLCLFLLLVYFCISFLRALPSHVASTDCASYLLLSIAWGKWDIMWLRDVLEVLARAQAMGGLAPGCPVPRIYSSSSCTSRACDSLTVSWHPLPPKKPMILLQNLPFYEACPIDDSDIFQFSFPVQSCSNSIGTEAGSWFKLSYSRKWEGRISWIKDLVERFMKAIQGWETVIIVTSTNHRSSHVFSCLCRKCMSFFWTTNTLSSFPWTKSSK